ncbi:uncharacterized protein A4U43_C09F9180 [Asparagus officinalis]|uniref:BTB domain-containing protein n=1 Tax=Asparagus officinalis TaxID=4686 RepID=A0A5P1E6B9_ASPOF|nr:uncharacterized protein A4U43_C09F9180 [Asparagus officinalis]
MRIYSDSDGFHRFHEAGKGHAPAADLQIVTSDGHRIAAHSNVIASASPVLENTVYKRRKNWSSERVIHILGVRSNVVFAFLQFIYSSFSTALSSAEAKETMEKYGIQLLVLAHKYRIDWLKKACEAEIIRNLKPESAVDILQIARLCDSPRLCQRCFTLISNEFPSVQKSDAWRFVHLNDPRLEIEILQFVEQSEQRRKRWRRARSDREMYEQLSEAMECLRHICIEGCSNVGPHDRSPPRRGEAGGAVREVRVLRGAAAAHSALCYVQHQEELRWLFALQTDEAAVSAALVVV